MPSSVRALALAVMVVAATALFVLVLRCSDSVEATLAAQQAQRAAPAALPLPLPLPLTTGRDGLPRLNPPQRVPGSVRLVLLSDTHTHHSELDVPDGDILIHAGDYALARDSAGRVREKKRFDEWLGKLPHRHKIFVQGNHDEGQPGSAVASLQNAVSLVDKLTEIEVRGRTVRIYGSPWQPQFTGWPTWMSVADCAKKWDQIPKDVDILVTHTPIYKYGDGDKGYDRGDVGLLKAIKLKRPTLSVFGHIHDGWPRAGTVPETGGDGGGGGTTFLNVAVTDNTAHIANPVVIYDL